jgi:predicted DNA-binding transcriptional regulator AlpA
VHLHRLEAAGQFPRRFKLGVGSGKYGAVGHALEEVMEWLEARKRSRGETADGNGSS